MSSGCSRKPEASPTYVPLKIAVRVYVSRNHFREEVKKSLLEAFSNRVFPDGRRGFFPPHNFAFGQPLFLSNVCAAAMKIDGVRSVEVQEFGRLGKPDGKELIEGVIRVRSFEVVQLENDPNHPEKGRIDIVVG